MTAVTLASTPGVAIEYRETVTPQTRAQWSWAVPVTSHWQTLALKEILQAAALPADWDTYGSPSPAPRLVDTCIALVGLVDYDDLPVPRVIPIPEGGIQFEWTTGERELEVAVLPEGHIEFLKIQGGEPVDEGKLSVRDYGQFLSLLTWVK